MAYPLHLPKLPKPYCNKINLHNPPAPLHPSKIIKHETKNTSKNKTNVIRQKPTFQLSPFMDFSQTYAPFFNISSNYAYILPHPKTFLPIMPHLSYVYAPIMLNLFSSASLCQTALLSSPLASTSQLFFHLCPSYLLMLIFLLLLLRSQTYLILLIFLLLMLWFSFLTKLLRLCPALFLLFFRFSILPKIITFSQTSAPLMPCIFISPMFFRLTAFPNKSCASLTFPTSPLPPMFPALFYQKYPNSNIYVSHVIHWIYSCVYVFTYYYVILIMHFCIPMPIYPPIFRPLKILTNFLICPQKLPSPPFNLFFLMFCFLPPKLPTSCILAPLMLMFYVWPNFNPCTSPA